MEMTSAEAAKIYSLVGGWHFYGKPNTFYMESC